MRPILFIILIITILSYSCGHGRIHPMAIKYNQKAIEHITEGELEEAKASLELALEYSPNYSEPYSNLGLIYYKLRDYKKAKLYYLKALELNGDLAQAHNNLGVIFIKEHNYKRAIFCFKEALRVNPHYFEARWNLIRGLIYLGDLTEARRQAFILIEAYPEKARSYAILSQIALSLGQIEEAKKSISKAIELDSSDYYILKIKGILSIELGEYKDGETFLKKALATVREDDIELLTYLGIATFINGKIEEGETYIDKALIFEPKNSMALLTKAYIKWIKGDRTEAQLLLERTVSFEPTNSKAWLLLGRIYKENKEQGKAVEAYKKFINFASPKMEKEIKEALSFINANSN